jgi:hypothetical protein
LQNLSNGLPIKENAVKYTNGFLDKSCTSIQNMKRNYAITDKMGVPQTILEKI